MNNKKFQWIENLSSEDWNKAISVANDCEEMDAPKDIVANAPIFISNIIYGFLLKIFGIDKDEKIRAVMNMINNDLLETEILN